MTRKEAEKLYYEAEEEGDTGGMFYEVMTQWLLNNPSEDNFIKVLMLMENIYEDE